MSSSTDEPTSSSLAVSQTPQYNLTTVDMVENKTIEEVIIILKIFFNCIFTLVIAVIGCLGNTLTLIVLVRIGFKDTSNIILVSLAGWDLLYLLCLFVKKMDCVLIHLDPLSHEIFWPYVQTYTAILNRTALLISTTHIVIIAIERFLAVFYPFKISRWVTPKRILVILVCVCVAFFVMTSPYMFGYFTIEWYFNEIYNRTLPKERLAPFFLQHRRALDIYNQLILTILTRPVYTFTVVLFSLAISIKLRIMSKQRAKLSGRRTESGIDIKASRMLLAVCFIYIVFGAVSFAVYMYVNHNKSVQPATDFYYFLFDIEECFAAGYSASNFIVYVIMSSKFYESLRSLCCPIRISISSNRNSQTPEGIFEPSVGVRKKKTLIS